MCPLIDTSAFAAFINKKDKDHKRAQEIFSDIRNGRKYVKPITNEFVLDETITLVRKRTKRHNLAVKIADFIMKTRNIDFQWVKEDDVEKALKDYRRYDDKDLSFTDWVLVSHIKRNGMKQIIAFDRHFDQVGLERIF